VKTEVGTEYALPCCSERTLATGSGCATPVGNVLNRLAIEAGRSSSETQLTVAAPIEQSSSGSTGSRLIPSKPLWRVRRLGRDADEVRIWTVSSNLETPTWSLTAGERIAVRRALCAVITQRPSAGPWRGGSGFAVQLPIEAGTSWLVSDQGHVRQLDCPHTMWWHDGREAFEALRQSMLIRGAGAGLSESDRFLALPLAQRSSHRWSDLCRLARRR
jgi:hypothetical protein